eukprot:SAG31_NODE_743_length_12418_cov_3.780908_14_plen_268_part_00
MHDNASGTGPRGPLSTSVRKLSARFERQTVSQVVEQLLSSISIFLSAHGRLAQALEELRHTHAELMSRSAGATDESGDTQKPDAEDRSASSPPSQPSSASSAGQMHNRDINPRSSTSNVGSGAANMIGCASVDQVAHLTAAVAELQSSVHLMRSELALGLGQMRAFMSSSDAMAADTGSARGDPSIEMHSKEPQVQQTDWHKEQEIEFLLELRVGSSASLAAGAPVKMLPVSVILPWGTPPPVVSGSELRWALRRALAIHPDQVCCR